MRLFYHPESDSYFIEKDRESLGDSIDAELSNDVTDILEHVNIAKRRGVIMTEIANVSMPEEKPKKTRKPSTRARKPKATGPNPASKLIDALKFLSVAQKKVGTVNVTYCNIANGWACASDGILTIGTKIEEDLNACPHTMQLIDALGEVSDELSITQLSMNALAVTSGPFKGLVSCIDAALVPISAPDPVGGQIDDRLAQALAATYGIVNETAENVAYRAICVTASSVISTNGFIALEAWHGLNLPPQMLLPRCAAVAVAKAGKKLVGLGYSGPSATFWFEDGSFIKTQLFNERFPDVSNIIASPEPYLPLSPEFFKAVKAVDSLSESGKIRFDDNAVHSDFDGHDFSTYSFEGSPNGTSFTTKLLLSIQDHMGSCFFVLDQKGSKVYFANGNVRGVLAGLAIEKAKPENYYNPVTHPNKTGFDNIEDEIPF